MRQTSPFPSVKVFDVYYRHGGMVGVILDRGVVLKLWRQAVYFESRKREVKIILMNEGRCDERRKTRVEESTFLPNLQAKQES